ncbi:LOW QUALITY PROTEIN: cytochrome b561 domain-containing protein At4g18260-like [Actinidia eriantha]|uniref:LOW QUALITY PROTEIN: cytochrome b561 domain-containing protein At4g18260-like n=1 Tax=Actinidia eriantha TaxID=165200 RepID=UPI00258BEAAD|nr:LOW QUALITY PROTEIN: cytochrome b561 domain-containing protein At4g18260-like [Actinidia eriantha]
MKIIKKLMYSTSNPTNLILLVLPFVGCSSHEQFNEARNSHSIKHSHKVSRHKTSDIIIHGLLLWASIGFLMPLGILTIRMSNREQNRRWFKVSFYFHAIFQSLSVLLATVGAVLSIKNFENSFNNHHQRIGLALYGAVWLQALIGFRRPNRGNKGRRLWYFAHWLLGTTISLVGIFNIYTGLEAYNKRTSKSTSLWTILFTTQVFFMAILYLIQDKWEYMQKQGVILGNEPVRPSSDQVIPREELKEPCRKSNSLGNYFAKNNALKKLFQLT